MNKVRLVAMVAGFLLVVPACSGDDGGGESGTAGTADQEVTTTIERPSLDIDGDFAAVLQVVASNPPDVVPAEQQTGERTLSIATGGCPAGSGGDLFTPLPVDGQCIGAITISGGETAIEDAPLYEQEGGDSWTTSYERIADCVAESGAVIAADGVTATETWTITPAAVESGLVIALEGTTEFAQEFAPDCPVSSRALRSASRSIVADRL